MPRRHYGRILHQKVQHHPNSPTSNACAPDQSPKSMLRTMIRDKSESFLWCYFLISTPDYFVQYEHQKSISFTRSEQAYEQEVGDTSQLEYRCR